jgi:hypothetical protein
MFVLLSIAPHILSFVFTNNWGQSKIKLIYYHSIIVFHGIKYALWAELIKFHEKSLQTLKGKFHSRKNLN